MTTVTHRVLETPELLSTILSFSNQQSQSRCAVVCKSWSPVALDCLWSVLDSVIPLLQLLGELISEGRRYCLAFAKAPSQEDWDRFNKYAVRVKSMTFGSCSKDYRGDLDIDDDSIMFSQGLFVEIAIRRRTPFILSNLTSLSLDASWDTGILRQGVAFFGRLKSLQISLGFKRLSYLEKGWQNFFEDVVALSPGLEELVLRTQLDDAFMPLVLFGTISERSISCLTSLKKISLPAEMMTAAVFTVLSILPSLQSVCFSRSSFKARDCHMRYRHLPDGSFRKLIELCLPISAQEVNTIWMTMHSAFENLTTLFVACVDEIRPSVMQQFINELPQNCSDLHSLVLIGAGYGGDADDRDLSLFIGPIFAMQSLRELTLVLRYKFSVTDSDSELEAFLSDRSSSLEILNLPRESPSLTLRALPILARHCPRLRSLSLMVNMEDIPDSDVPQAKPTDSFLCLDRLNFWSSSITDSKVSSTALFLSTVFASTPTSSLPTLSAKIFVPEVEDRGCSIIFDELIDDMIDLTEELSKHWTEVRRMMKVIREVTDIRENHIRRLEEELAQARADNALLQNMLMPNVVA